MESVWIQKHLTALRIKPRAPVLVNAEEWRWAATADYTMSRDEFASQSCRLK
jgi:hypothetical protein|eukprot:COSAG02_NODE_701_length_18335_cov_18.672955_2_plen_52_part_00